ncbi:SDR family oxidoreductase [Actinomycetospora straminea]|uniref:SDR family oxidoreductase n=1 Tax=Actinomycetospora straminea TaxID=663607 RepID=A0ABP9DU26_9PSEU|nr:SDR family oxidoreductase [Actinomycetospora straminea]MDD7935184.1 SDR family oxidoreductase [Actinomycetospora straminea]
MTEATPPAQDLAGRSALVTGASRGIGLGVARHLLDRGASVTLTARKPGQLDEAVAELDEPDRVLAVAGNSGDAAARARAVDAAVERFGSLDVLVNNAATNPQYGPLMEADLGAVSKIFDVNVVAALGFVQEAHRAWMGEHGGAVVNMASVGGFRSSGVIGAYGASKAALIRLTEELAWELGPSIRVNAVAPALVKTRMAEALWSGQEDEIVARYPMRRLGTTGDVAALVGFLVSDAAAWITGETVRVDGGLLATGST